MKKIIYPIFGNTLISIFIILASPFGIADNSFHPDFSLRQSNGEPWQQGGPYSEEKTCGQCHNTQRIHNSLAPHHLAAFPEENKIAYRLKNTASAHTGSSGCLTCHASQPQKITELISANGKISAEKLNLTSPSSNACGKCHSAVHINVDEPFTLPKLDKNAIFGLTGETYVAQHISLSALNIKNKSEKDFAFDIHAARVLSCADCHHSPNNPAIPQTDSAALQYDPRTLSAHEYLENPQHNFDAPLSCTNCHNTDNTHQWLPYFKQHTLKLSCETCHASWIAAPAIKAINLNSSEAPLWRGIEGSLIEGYQPWFLFNKNGKLSPFNVIAVSDNNKNYTVAKPIHHNISKAAALKDCVACHSKNSILTKPLEGPPGNIPENIPENIPSNIPENIAKLNNFDHNHRLNLYHSGLYIIGTNPLPLVDILGLLLILGTSFTVAAHGVARYLAYKKYGPSQHPRTRVYMYSFYHRLWHWLQAALILLLMFSGAAIHKPYLFESLNFAIMVRTHNILGFILVLNALLALFYHLASGEIKQFIPMGDDFFVKTFQQINFYLRDIFQGKAHPFEKLPEQKLNPLQKLAYFGLLHALLPAQIITGIFMWGAQYFPEAATVIGGLTWLGPIHSLLAWAFLAFLIMHIYLTTTSGPKPLSGIQAMVSGWEDVETPATRGNPHE